MMKLSAYALLISYVGAGFFPEFSEVWSNLTVVSTVSICGHVLAYFVTGRDKFLTG